MSEITNAIKQICEEKNLSYDAVLETIESALAAAYRKDFGEKNQNIKVEFDPETAKSKVFDVKTVVEDLPEIEEVDGVDGIPNLDSGAGEDVAEKLKSQNSKVKIETQKSKVENLGAMVKAEAEAGAGTEAGVEAEAAMEERKFNPKTELQIKDAKLIKKTAKVGDVIRTKLPIPADYGRMAAQTAKQVIIQKLREAERDMVFNEFKSKEHEVVAGVVQRREGRIVLIDLGKAVGILPSEEQIMGERYKQGDRIKVYVKSVGTGPRGPEIILSRTSEEILKKVFYLEIPEIANGLVEIKAVAREAGNRSKVAVFASGENVDPIGSCVGQRGARIQTIISELGGEKIDIIEYDEDPAKFIAKALSPAKVINVELTNEEKKAIARVAEEQLSLAIGREGQNVRLAARLTGWKLDIMGEKQENNKTKKQENNEAENMSEVGKEAKLELAVETEKEIKAESAAGAEEAAQEKVTGETTEEEVKEEGTATEEVKTETEPKEEAKAEKVEKSGKKKKERKEEKK